MSSDSSRESSYIKVIGIIFYVMYTLKYSFELTYIHMSNTIDSMLLMFCVVLAILAMTMMKMSVKELIVLIGIIIIGLSVYWSSKESLYIMLIFAAIMIRTTDYRTALWTIFITKFILTLMIVLLSLLSIIPIGHMLVPKGIFGFVMGYSLGFSHPNNMAESVFFLIAAYLCIKEEKITIYDGIVIAIVEEACYQITKSKATFLLIILMLLLIFLRNTSFIKFIIKKLYGIYILLISLVISILLPMIYAMSTGVVRSISFELNGLLNGRLSNASHLYELFNLTSFGEIVNDVALKQRFGYGVVDNGYSFALFNYGIVGLTLIMLLYLISVRNLLKQGHFVYVIVILMFLTLGISENIIRAPYMNFTMIFWYEAIFFNQGLNKDATKII
ncbi:hypothetical protein [Ligilactobacillus equi]|nr:hypothetical protein [Ligilactobacillus equi]